MIVFHKIRHYFATFLLQIPTKWHFVGKVASFDQVDEFLTVFHMSRRFSIFCCKSDGENLTTWLFVKNLASFDHFLMVFKKIRHFLLLFAANWMVKTLRRGILLEKFLVLAKSMSFSWFFTKSDIILQLFAAKLDGENYMMWLFVKNLGSFGQAMSFSCFLNFRHYFATFCWKTGW